VAWLRLEFVEEGGSEPKRSRRATRVQIPDPLSVLVWGERRGGRRLSSRPLEGDAHFRRPAVASLVRASLETLPARVQTGWMNFSKTGRIRFADGCDVTQTKGAATPRKG
jgi:hypothetical protein